MNDITGMRFGNLTVVRYAEEHWKSNMWECKCDCGRHKAVPYDSLMRGSTKSCGCLTARNLTGERFNMLTVIRWDKITKKWECKCDCGGTTNVTPSNLVNGRVKSCGCLRGGKAPKDLTGQTFGKLTALRPTDQRKGSSVVWECKCECGGTAYKSTAELREGGPKSCGCLIKRDITGERFGKLVALRPTEKRSHRYVVWECQCDCGNVTLVDVNSLRNNRIKSCGCLKRGETKDSVPLKIVPVPTSFVPKGEKERKERNFKSRKVDYEKKAKAQKEIGDAGELLVLEYEKKNLIGSDYINKVRHESKENGDGAGYDIESVQPNGEPKYIEVKTTTGGVGESFHLTATELECSKKRGKSFFLYRVFDYDKNKKTGSCYILNGNLEELLDLVPDRYVATVRCSEDA